MSHGTAPDSVQSCSNSFSRQEIESWLRDGAKFAVKFEDEIPERRQSIMREEEERKLYAGTSKAYEQIQRKWKIKQRESNSFEETGESSKESNWLLPVLDKDDENDEDTNENQQAGAGSSNMAIDILMELEYAGLEKVKDKFEKKEEEEDDGLSLQEFVDIMTKNLPPRKNEQERAELLLNLVELFSQIDFNGDGSLEWLEFTSFISEAAAVQRFTQDSVGSYKKTALQSEPFDEPARRIRFYPTYPYFLYCGREKRLRAYEPENLRTIYSIDHDGGVLDVVHVPTRKMIVTSSELHIHFFDDETMTKKTMSDRLSCAHTSMFWMKRGEKEFLLSGSREGQIFRWNEKEVENYALGASSSISLRKEKSTYVGHTMFSKSLIQHEDAVLDMIFVEKKNNLATAGMDGLIHIWDLEKESVTNTLRGHRNGVNCMSYSADLQLIISAGFEPTAYIWNPTNGTRPLKLNDMRRPHTGYLVGARAFRSSAQVITADQHGMVKIWDVRNLQCLQTWYCPEAARLRRITAASEFNQANILSAFVYDEGRSRLITSDTHLSVFECEKALVLHRAHTGRISRALYNHVTAEVLTAAGRDVKIWDCRSGRLKHFFPDLTEGEITDIVLDERGRKFFIASTTGEIRVFNGGNGGFVKNYEQTEERGYEVTRMLYFMGKHELLRMFVVATEDCRLILESDQEPDVGVQIKELDVELRPSKPISCLGWSCDGSFVLAGTGESRILVWDYLQGKLCGECLCQAGEIMAICTCADFPAFFACCSHGYNYLWTTRPYPYPNQLLLKWFNAPNDAFHAYGTSICYDSSSENLITGDEKGVIRVWNITEILHQCRFSTIEWGTPAAKHKFAEELAYPPFLKPNLTEEMVPCIYEYSLFQDLVRSIELIPSPHTLLSSSEEGRVVFHSMSGEMIGEFLHTFDPSKKFAFEVDDKSRFENSVKRTYEILELEPPESIEHDPLIIVRLLESDGADEETECETSSTQSVSDDSIRPLSAATTFME